MLCKALFCFAKIWIDYSKITKIWLAKFVMFKRLSTILISISKSGYASFEIEKILKIEQKTFALLLIKCRYFFWVQSFNNIHCRNITRQNYSVCHMYHVTTCYCLLCVHSEGQRNSVWSQYALATSYPG